MKRVLSSVLVLLIIISGLGACSAKPKPETTLLTFLESYKAQETMDYSTLFDAEVPSTMSVNPFEDSTTPSEITNKMTELILSYEVEVLDSVIAKDGQSAVVTVQFTTVNIGLVFTTYMMNYMAKAFELAFSGASEEQLNQVGIDLFLEAANGAVKDKVSKVDIEMVFVDKAWRIHLEEGDTALFDAMMGGLISTLKDFNPTPEAE